MAHFLRTVIYYWPPKAKILILLLSQSCRIRHI